MRPALEIDDRKTIIKNILIDISKVISSEKISEENNPFSQNIGQYKHIVIIDDDPRIRVLFAHVLEKAGYDVITFGDNAGAIQYLKNNNHIDLLILDLNMPHVDGRYFCEILRMKHPAAKVLISSNYALDVQKYLILDADDYFDKAQGIKVLREKVNRALQHKIKTNFIKKGGA